MLQIISLIILAVSGYFWFTTGQTFAVFMCGGACASSVWFFCFGIYNDFMQKEVAELKALIEKL